MRVSYLVLCSAVLLSAASSARGEDTKATKKKVHKKNRLAKEKSPYLRQHATNPVDWYPWGKEAFAKAKQENKLVFLSIGYATCHWCHVMERESFENQTVAKFLNANYVAVKVDREERPDIDEIYMTAVRFATGGGGWPLSVFLTPDAKPLPHVREFARHWGSSLTGGTYFPMPARWGRKSFLEEIKIRAELWKKHHKAMTKDAKVYVEMIKRAYNRKTKRTKLEVKALHTARGRVRKNFDTASGGFPGEGSKSPTRFPMPHISSFLLRYHQRTKDPTALAMVEKTLTEILRGGLRDHLGGGFHRYSVDTQWEIPHFEKMLYDQAGLVRAFVEAHLVTRRSSYAAVARETLDFVLREMTSKEGGFTSAWDADSEGQEGKFYVWTHAEVKKLLGGGKDFEMFAARYGVTEEGNFHELKKIKNLNHLQLSAVTLEDLAKKHGLERKAVEARLAACRAKLLAARSKRIPPLHDDKVLTDWNGLMIGSAALAGRALAEPRYTQAAARAATFVLKTLKTKQGKLLHRYREGSAGIRGMLEDYAFLIWGLVELYQSTYSPRWLVEAKALSKVMIADFWDAKGQGFFQTDAKTKLIARPKPIVDSAIPSGNGVAALALFQLGTLTMDPKLARHGELTLQSYSHTLAHRGGSMTTVGLMALDFMLGPTREVVVAGDPKQKGTQALLEQVRRRFLPRTVVIHRPLGPAKELVAVVPFVKAQIARGGKPTAYVCTNFSCKAPVQDVRSLATQLRSK